jgi:hypothetical protein
LRGHEQIAVVSCGEHRGLDRRWLGVALGSDRAAEARMCV